MMDCARARDGLMEADVAELQGHGGTALAEHLRTCAVCRAKADAILATYTALDASLSTEPPRRMPRALRWLAVAVPLAAAAALVLVLGQPPERFGTPPAAAVTPTPPAAPLVSAPSARDVTIMHTDDPNIVVVWLN